MVLVAPRSAKLVETRGARFTLLAGYLFCLLGFVTMLLLWKEGIPYWQVGLAYALHRDRRRLRRHPRVALPHWLGAGATGSAWRREPPTCSATSAARSCSQSWGPAHGRVRLGDRRSITSAPNQDKITDSVAAQLQKSFDGAIAVAQQYPKYADQITAAAKSAFLEGDQWAYIAGIWPCWSVAR